MLRETSEVKKCFQSRFSFCHIWIWCARANCQLLQWRRLLNKLVRFHHRVIRDWFWGCFNVLIYIFKAFLQGYHCFINTTNLQWLQAVICSCSSLFESFLHIFWCISTYIIAGPLSTESQCYHLEHSRCGGR